MQTKEDLEDFYSKQDPWDYRVTRDDAIRRSIICDIAKTYCSKQSYERALDIGCGEGFITKKLPAKNKYGIEISDNATKRLPNYVKRITKPDGKYDLVVCTGQLYQQYDYQTFIDWILEHASGTVITSHYDQMTEMNDLPEDKKIFRAKFKYREGNQNLYVYDFTSQYN